MKTIFSILFGALLCSLYADQFQIPVHYDTLKNGLRIIIVPDTNVAVVSCRLYYFVGSMYEGPGSSGLSHMYEHMMFKGTKRIGTKSYNKEIPLMASIDSLADIIHKERLKGKTDSDSLIQDLKSKMYAILEKQRQYMKKEELWETYQNNGGTNLNAWTADDMTAYIVTLPKNKLELFYWLESDRMKDPVLREFYSERDVVAEERRMRYENRPLNRYWERLNSLFYVAHPYRLPTIGWMSDIEAYTREKMENHIRKFYTPDNALIVMVGNVDPKKAMIDIKRYFSSIPRSKITKTEVVTREPQPIGVTRFTVHDNVAPRIDMMFHTPGYPHDDLYKIDIIEGIFSGRSGRLYRRLVDKEKLCINVGAANSFRLHDGYFHIWAELKSDADPKKVEQIILEEIKNLSSNPPTANEMSRITNQIRMSFITGLKSLEGLSDRLAWFERLNSWKDLLSYPDKIAQVKPEEISAIAIKYINPQLMTIGQLLPIKPEKAPVDAQNENIKKK
ncbi:MAG: insulinase family protein [Fibrobacter sp.]|jgi:predicted Zn-dependent peptidase|nr:insulinase family protein [Fibrobacter sp.]